jgi:hypothetical protein
MCCFFIFLTLIFWLLRFLFFIYHQVRLVGSCNIFIVALDFTSLAFSFFSNSIALLRIFVIHNYSLIPYLCFIYTICCNFILLLFVTFLGSSFYSIFLNEPFLNLWIFFDDFQCSKAAEF